MSKFSRRMVELNNEMQNFKIGLLKSTANRENCEH